MFDRSDEQELDYRIAEDMSICGVGHDLVYLDEKGLVRIAAADPRGAFLISKTTVDGTPLAGVRYWTHRGKTRGEIYYPHMTKQFVLEGGKTVVTGELETPFRAEFTAVPQQQGFRGDFEPVIDNIDIHNLVLSGATDDLQSIANAYLVLSGMEKPDDEALEVLRTERVIGLPSDGGAEYITKNLNDSAVENHKKTLRQDIMQVAGVPDLTDESFAGNSSGGSAELQAGGLISFFRKKCAAMDRGAV